MKKLTLELLQEMIEITQNPDEHGLIRLKLLSETSVERVQVVAVAAMLAISEDRHLRVDDYMLLIDLENLN